jgi:hypothetical protein
MNGPASETCCKAIVSVASTFHNLALTDTMDRLIAANRLDVALQYASSEL